MKFFKLWFSLFLFYISTSLFATTENYTLDKNHTYVLWSIDHLGFSTQYGKWYADGELVLDEDNPNQSKVKVKINVDDMITGIAELDKHLKSPLFFDTKNFPEATFVSNKVNAIDKNTADVEGVLTVRGISKPVVLKVTLNKSAMNPITNKMTIGFTATTTIKRSDFGMTAFLPSLSDTVNLIIGAEGYQNKKVG